MKHKLLAAILASTLAISFAAVAADNMVAEKKDEPAIKEKPAKKQTKAKPHSHAEANKQGSAPAEKANASDEVKKPLHDHQKEHK